MKYPFLFRKESEFYSLGAHLDPAPKYFVKIAKLIDYVHYDSSWMDSPYLGDSCLVPDVDICEEMHEFASEAEAIQFIANWWKAGKGD